MTAEEATAYHAGQVNTFATTAADMVNAMTMTYPEEAIGVLRAAVAAGLPCGTSFTVDTDGAIAAAVPWAGVALMPQPPSAAPTTSRASA